MSDWFLWVLGSVAGITMLFAGAWVVRQGLDYFEEYTGREKWKP